MLVISLLYSMRNDSQHRAAIELEQRLGDEYQFVSTVFVVQEMCWLFRKG